MADGETAATAYTIGWEPQPGPQTALLACPVFEVFLGVSVFLAPSFLAPQHAVIAFQRDVEYLPLFDWPLKPLVPGRYTAGPTQADIGLEGLRQGGEDDLTSEGEIWIDQSIR